MTDHQFAQGPTGIPAVQSKLLRSNTGSGNDLCGFTLWINLASTALLKTECWKNLWCHLIYPFSSHFFQHPFLPGVFFPALLCVSQSWGLGPLFHGPEHLQAQRMGCQGLLCITELQQFASTMRNNVTSVNPLSLWAKLNQFSVRLPWAEGVHKARMVIWVKCACLWSHDSSATL